MNKIIAVVFFFCLSLFSLAQSSINQKLIELGKAYKNYMFMNDPPKDFIKNLQSDVPESLKVSTNFIAQTITTGNDLLTKKFLTLPDDQSIKYIYIICSVSENLRHDNHTDNNKLIDSLIAVSIPRNELIERYYSMLFTGVGNKNKPFDLSKIDFKLKDYNLTDETAEGIFFLSCMSFCGSEIWGYMHIPKPPNTKKAYEFIKKFPKFNGADYYQFTDLSFPDFTMVIDKDKGVESYKGYYMDKYYDLLLSHLICLKDAGAKDDQTNKLLLGSILKDKELYKYSKNKAVLEQLFKEQKQ